MFALARKPRRAGYRGARCGVIFSPTHTVSSPCVGKTFTVEVHHKHAERAKPGDSVGFNPPRGSGVEVEPSGEKIVAKALNDFLDMVCSVRFTATFDHGRNLSRATLGWDTLAGKS